MRSFVFLEEVMKYILCFILEWQKWTGLFLQRKKKTLNSLSPDRHKSL